MVKKSFLLLVILIITITSYSQELVDSTENYATYMLANNTYATTIYNKGNKVSYIFVQANHTYEACQKDLIELGFKNYTEARSWRRDNIIAYILWDWRNKTWFIVMYFV